MEDKSHRLISGYISILFVLMFFFGCGQATGQIEDQKGEKSSQSETSQSNNQAGSMPQMFKGKVVEAIDAGRYTYVQIDTGEKKVWVAVQDFKAKTGDEVVVPPGDPVADFQSKKLNRKFDMIYFVGSIHKADAATMDMLQQTLPKGHPSIGMSEDQEMTHPPMNVTPAQKQDIKGIEKAEGGQTVSEIITNRLKLDGKSVSLRAKVVKFTPEIMDKNWLHVQDGSGDENSNDLIVTTKAVVKVGDVVLIKGIVVTDRDFGFGLKYRVIIEDAEITVE